MDDKSNANVTNTQDLTNTQLIQAKSKSEITRNVSNDKPVLTLLSNSSNKKNRVRFNTNYITVVKVQSFKQYNSQVFEEIDKSNKECKCKCKIF